MTRIPAVLALVLFAAPAKAADAPYPLTERNKADIVRRVKDYLADGESARWRWPLHQPGYGLYCGWVNAKNRFGAYAGWQQYMVVGGVGSGPKSTGEFSIDMVEFEPEIVATMCGRYDYDLSGPPPE